MEKEKRTSAHRWMRILHRDIGFFVVGLTVIYCISGVMLTLRTTDFLKSETFIEKTIDSGLNAGQLNRALHLRDMKVVSENEHEIVFINGTYIKDTGAASYTSHGDSLDLARVQRLAHRLRQRFPLLVHGRLCPCPDVPGCLLILDV